MQYKNKKQIEEELMKDWSYEKIKDNNGYSLLTDDTDYNNPISPQNIFDRLHQIRQDDLNAIKEMINGLEYGGYALSSNDSRRGSDEMRTDILQELDNLNKETNYERDYSHSHCFNNKNSACGNNSDKHLHCCICGIKNTNLNKE